MATKNMRSFSPGKGQSITTCQMAKWSLLVLISLMKNVIISEILYKKQSFPEFKKILQGWNSRE